MSAEVFANAIIERSATAGWPSWRCPNMPRDLISPEDEVTAALCSSPGHNAGRRGNLLGKNQDWLDQFMASQVAKAIGSDDAARRRHVRVFRHLPGIWADFAGKARPRPPIRQPYPVSAPVPPPRLPPSTGSVFMGMKNDIGLVCVILKHHREVSHG